MAPAVTSASQTCGLSARRKRSGVRGIAEPLQVVDLQELLRHTEAVLVALTLTLRNNSALLCYARLHAHRLTQIPEMPITEPNKRSRSLLTCTASVHTQWTMPDIDSSSSNSYAVHLTNF
jgi:hypothetical protein